MLLRRNKRAKRAIFKLDHAQQKITLTVPDQLSDTTIQELITGHASWLEQQRQKLTPTLYFEAGMSLPILGSKRQILNTGEKGEGPLLTISHLLIPGAPHQLGRRIETFLKQQARNYFSALAAKKATKLNKRITRVSVKDTRSQWGSCSSKGQLSFSWRLYLAPEFVVDYVIAHEVAHLVEMNHSSKFWAICDSLSQHRCQAEEWLRKNGGTLHRFKRKI